MGYGCGVGLATLFGHIVLKKGEPPFFLPYQVLIFAAGVIVFICSFAAFLGILKIRRLEPAMVFRA